MEEVAQLSLKVVSLNNGHRPVPGNLIAMRVNSLQAAAAVQMTSYFAISVNLVFAPQLSDWERLRLNKRRMGCHDLGRASAKIAVRRMFPAL
jgi:hypothetical protein